MSLVCRICLRSGFVRTKDVDDTLAEFHDELCDFDVFVNGTFTFCLICEHQLIKFYNFKQKCRRAHRILKSKRSNLRKEGVACLHKLMPPESIGYSTPDDKQGIYYVYSSVTPNITVHNQTGDHIILIDCNNIEPTEEILTSDTDNLALKTEELVSETGVFTPKDEKETSPIIKTEFDDTITETPILFIEDVEIVQDDPIEMLGIKQELDVSVDDTPSSDDPDRSHFNEERLEDFLDSDDETPLSKSVKQKKSKIKQVKIPKLLSAKLDDILKKSPDSDSNDESDIIKSVKSVKSREKKAPIKKVSLLTEEISLDDLKFLNKTFCKSDRFVVSVQKGILELKHCVLNLIEQGKLDLGENVTLTKESFLDMYSKCDKSLLRKRGVFKQGRGFAEKLKKFLLFLLKKYNPEYETIFNIEYLTTRAMKLAEFEARKKSKEYVTALFKCDKCYKGFELQSLLDYHNKWHDASRPHACDICSMRFTGSKHLNVHKRSSHYSLYRCKLCEVHTYSFDVMVNHYNQHKGVRYTCEVCLGEYSSKSCLNTHRLTHATHACTHCARSFVSDTGLNNHIKIKHPGAIVSETSAPASPQRVSCDKCDAIFKSRDVLNRHKKIIHSGNNNLFKCRYAGCLQHFSSAAELRLHSASSGHVRRCPPDGGRRRKWACAKVRARINVTGPDKPYRKCPVCQEQIPNKFPTALYKHHLAAHPAEPYEGADARATLCEHCGKAFVHRSIYRDHLNTHTGARPYACRECGARFHMRRALYLHRDRHGPPRHQCKECGKMFRTAANLFSHMRMHVGDRRFKCEICFKGFLHAGSLKEHINGVHHQIRRIKRTK